MFPLRLTRAQILFWLACILVKYILATYLPITNDEAYYWGWGQDLRLSYMDHPPFVAWIAAFSDSFTHTIENLFQLNLLHLKARFASILCSILATFFLLASIQSLHKNWRTLTWVGLFLTQLTPGLSFLGLALLPDAGLLMCLSLLLFLGLKLSSHGKNLSFLNGLTLGVVAGLAICAKYHAFVLIPGIGIAVLTHRAILKLPIQHNGFYLSFLAGILMGAAPVWIWNIKNDWISIRFQSDHGFGGLGFHSTFGLRTLAGQLVLLSPILWFLPVRKSVLALKHFFRKPQRQISIDGVFLIWIFLPLFGLLFAVSWFKQTLPHWVLPAYWLAIPFIAKPILHNLSKKSQLFTLGWGVLFSVLLPAFLISSPLISYLVKSSEGAPRGISEVSLWDPLMEDVAKVHQIATQIQEGATCQPTLLGLRWFYIAQIKYRDPSISMHTFDLNHPSFYHFENASWLKEGCTAIIIGDARHFDQNLLADWVFVQKKKELLVKGHEEMPLFYWIVMFKKSFPENLRSTQPIELLKKW